MLNTNVPTTLATPTASNKLSGVPAEVVAAWSDLRRTAIPDETVEAIGEALAQQPQDGFTAKTRHLLGPLSVVLQRALFDAPDHTPVQSFCLWRDVPRKKALALAHVVGELLFFGGHTAVAVAVVDSLNRGVSFRFTTAEADFIARDLVGPAAERAA
jgi:hypothetical protein